MKLTFEQETRLTERLVPTTVIPSLENARVAIVHYWFVSHRGGERVARYTNRVAVGVEAVVGQVYGVVE